MADPLLDMLGVGAPAAAPAGGDPLLAILQPSGSPEPAGAPSAPRPKPGTPFDKAARQVGLTARAAVSAATGLPTMAGDAVNGAINLGIHGVNSLFGSHVAPLQMPSQIVQKSMDSLGIPQPANDTERVVQAVTSGMGSAGPGVALGKALSKYGAPIVQEVGKGLASLPGMQIFGGAGAGAGGAIAANAGAGPVGQLLASVAGGAAGAVAPSTAIATARGAAGAAHNVSGAVSPVVNPRKYVGTQLATTLGDDAAALAAKLREIPEYVPGSKPTTSQAAPNPTLVATEKSMANANPNFKIALSAREANNNAARWQALNSVARTPEDLEAAIADRRAVTAPQYEAAHSQVAPMDETLLTLAQRPAVKQAMQQADLLAKNEGYQVKWPTPEDPHISGKALDYTSRALDDMIGAARSAGKTEEVNALTGAQKKLQSWMEDNVPGVREAASDYRTFSSPVNTMQAGQQIAGTLGTRGLDVNGLPQIQLSPYRTALVQALKKQAYGIDEGAHKTLQGIGQDLQRSTISNSLRSPGSDTAYNIAADGWLARQLYGKDFGGATMLGKGVGALGATLTGHPLIGAGIIGGGKKLGETVAKSLNEQLAELLLNPEALLPYLDAKQAPKALARSLRGGLTQGAVGASLASRPNP